MKRYVLLVAVVLFVAGCGAAATGETTSSINNAVATTAVKTTVPVETTIAAETTTSITPTEWVTVATLSGEAQKIGETFELTGAPTRLSYEVTGDYAVAAIYVMEDGKSLEKDGGIPEVMVTEAASDQTLLKKDAGTYYLQVNANTPWKVTIEEQQ